MIVHIRWLIRRDMPSILPIEYESYEQPWLEEDFLRCMRQRNVIGMTAEDPRSTVVYGYMFYELYKSKLHLVKLAVDPRYRRAKEHEIHRDYGQMTVPGGVGTALINKLKGKLFGHRRTGLTVDVRESNLAAQLFFQKQGFEAVKILHGEFEDTGEDAYRMRYCIPAEPENTLVRICEDEACRGA